MNALEFISFLALSLHWSELMRCWQMTEALPIFHNCAYNNAYMRHIRFIIFITLLLALGKLYFAIFFLQFYDPTSKLQDFSNKFPIIAVEHLLCIGATVHSTVIYHSDKDIFTELIRSLVPHLVPQNEPLPIFLAAVICYINESATFVWNFLDIFIMVVGFGLSTHFKLLNDELEKAAVEMEVNLSSNTDAFMVERLLTF